MNEPGVDVRPGDDTPGIATAAGHTLVVTSSGAAAGGPGPNDPLAAVNLRQRIMSEAALRALAPGRKPLVVLFANDWVPTSMNGFFEGLDVDWINLTTVAGMADRAGTPVVLSRLGYPPRQARRELDAANFTSAESLISAGDSLDDVLTLNDRVAATVTDQALNATSYSSRVRPDSVRAGVDRSRAWIEDKLQSVTINAPRGVTLSSASGGFTATITNGLDEPVTVSIDAIADKPLTITPPEPVEIAAGSSTTVLFNARTSQLGVSNVTLVVTDSEGVPLGSSDELPIRSAQVSNVIWLILGTGAALLFGAIFVRLVRRVRRARSGATDPDPPQEPRPEPGPTS